LRYPGPAMSSDQRGNLRRPTTTAGGAGAAPPDTRTVNRTDYRRHSGRRGPEPTDDAGGWPGILLGLVATGMLHLVGSMLIIAALGEFVRRAGDVVTLYFGAVQLVYMVPAIVIARKNGFVWVARGLIGGAVITALMNAGCWVLASGIR
jgi:hypothetical protein